MLGHGSGDERKILHGFYKNKQCISKPAYIKVLQYNPDRRYSHILLVNNKILQLSVRSRFEVFLFSIRGLGWRSG